MYSDDFLKSYTDQFSFSKIFYLTYSKTLQILEVLQYGGPEFIAIAGLANALHIAAWRYGQPQTADQATIDYFLKVAEVANKAMGSPCNDSLFPRAMRAIK